MENDIAKKSKLMIFFHKMNEKEFKDLGLWVRSPFHNSNKNVVKLYDVLKSKYRKTDKEIESIDLMKYMEIIPRSAKQKDISPKHRQELRKVMSALAAQIEELFLWKKTKEDAFACKYKLMQALTDRQYYELLPSVLNRARKIHESSSLRNVKYYEDSHHLARMDFRTDIILDKRTVAVCMKSIASIDALRQFFLSELLLSYCVVINSIGIFKVEYDSSFMKLIMGYLKNSKDLNIPIIRAHYLLLTVLNGGNPENYHQLKDTLFSNLDTFDIMEQRSIFISMRNYCSTMIASNNSVFLKETFILDVVGINHGIWMINSFFSAHSFVLILKNALHMGNVKWAHSFLEKYGQQLPHDLKADTLNYCYATHAFYAQDYDDALEYLNKISTTKDIFHNLGYKILLIKIYYDKNEFNQSNIDRHPINNELEAIRQYTLPSTSKKMSEHLRQRYSNFANFFKRMLNRKKKLIYNKTLTRANIEALQIDLNEFRNLVESVWLKEKVSELMREVSGNPRNKNPGK